MCDAGINFSGDAGINFSGDAGIIASGDAGIIASGDPENNPHICMKVYSISKWAFYGICLLILILPVSRHWRLLFGGETARGVAGPYEMFIAEKVIGEDEIEYASTIVFVCEGKQYTTRGPVNFEYSEGRRINIRYDPEDPTFNCVLTFSGLYLHNYSILPLFLLTVWGAFYLSFNNYRKKKRSVRSSDLASSPYKPTGKAKGTKAGGPKVQRGFPRISPK